MNRFLLTICIATYNRADFLLFTLKGIVEQVNQYPDVEVLIADGNSTDNTESVVVGFQTICPNLRYLRLKEKGGIDKDYDLAVRHASGEHCWLFTDDDILKDNAIGKVREMLIDGTRDLLIVNSEICDFQMQRILKVTAMPNEFPIETNLVNANREMVFKLCAAHLTYIGCMVIRKGLWVATATEIFYGTRFIHVGVISTLPDFTKVLITPIPLTRIRLGNGEWSNISFKVWVTLWPNLIWSFPNLSDDCKKQICLRQPWKDLKLLFWYRAMGVYSKKHYLERIHNEPCSINKYLASFIASTPRIIPWVIFYLYSSLRRDQMQIYALGDGMKSRNSWHSLE